ncbi:MAG TPA: VWA domain-containing protein [Terriglobia bacterium]|nr:VWA domain-containing protein [Terriglobia bacterium]
MRIISNSTGNRFAALGWALAVCLLWTANISEHSTIAEAAGQAQNNGQTIPPKIVFGSEIPGQTNQQGNLIIRAQTNVVLVDVRVTDKHGQPINGLTKENFRVLEDGTPQSITSFSFENVEHLATAGNENGPPPVINLAKLPPDANPAKIVQDHRLLVLFFDMSSMQVDDLMRALKGATDFVHTRMTPADLVAVVSYTSTLNINQDFTNDRDVLEKTLRSLRVGESSSLADSGTTGDAGTTNAQGEEVVNQDVSAAFTPDETEYNIFNTDQKLAAVESLAKLLKDIPGRKSVIHFSSGVQKTGVDNDTQLLAATDAANQANVSLYTVDARGLAALPPGGDASTASPAGTAVYTGAAVHSQINSMHETRETLATLATDTGGKSFNDLNDFGEAFREVQSENSTYYLLGYTPSNTRSDGRFRRIKVEVNQPGVKIEARPGYFAPKDFRQFTREDKEVQLEQAMNLDSPFVDLPLAIETAYFRLPDKRFYVVLAAKIPGSSVSFLKKSMNHQTEFDFAWQATDSAGHTAGALRDTLPVKLAPDTYEQVVAGSFLYEGGFVLPPGKYKLKVVARENQSGKMGTFEEPLVLPDQNDSNLALSSVVLSNQLQDNAAAGAARPRKGNGGANFKPMQVGSRSVLPSVTRVFRTNQNLYVYLESYAPKPAKNSSDAANVPPLPSGAPASPPSVALVFFRGGNKISEAGPFAGKLESAKGGSATYFVQIPLAKFPPGRYWMQVNVLDPGADRVAFARIPLAIMRVAATPPAAHAGK